MRLEYERHSSTRMFDSTFLEACSKVHPVTPFLFYIPIVLGLLAWSLSGHSTLIQVAVAFPLGWLTWCVMEYGLHRHLFHWEGNGPFTRRFHEIIHGYHHKYPDDPLRLVMPLGASIPLAIVVGGLLSLTGRPDLSVPFFCGVVVGYLVYDFMHWATHYKTPLTAWGKQMRSHHMAHHFAEPNSNFGISHRWIDRLMGTLKKGRA